MPELLKSVEKLDDYTVRITAERGPKRRSSPTSPCPSTSCCRPNTPISSCAGGTPELLDQQPIGTGPFAFAGFQKDVAVRYRAFADYWAGKQPIDTLVFSITPNRGRAAHQAEGRRVPRHGVPEPRRPRQDRGGPEPAASWSRKGSTSAIWP